MPVVHGFIAAAKLPGVGDVGRVVLAESSHIDRKCDVERRVALAERVGVIGNPC